MLELGNNLLLSVCVITYNQEKYISQTLDSILQQEHSYGYEIVIGEDCSTDNTRKIIEEYVTKFPNIIKPIFNAKNIGLIKNYFNTINNCSGKYIMQCAGDDWWLPGKVRKQIAFMEANPDVGMCYGKAQIYKNGKKTFGHFGKKRENFEELLYKGNVIPAATVCYRREIYAHYANEIEPEKQNWLMEDYPMWLYFAKNGCIKFLNQKLGCYRILENSVSHSVIIDKQMSFEKSVYEIMIFFQNKYNYLIIKFDEEETKNWILYRRVLHSYDKKIANGVIEKLLDKPTLKKWIKAVLISNPFFAWFGRVIMK